MGTVVYEQTDEAAVNDGPSGAGVSDPSAERQLWALVAVACFGGALAFFCGIYLVSFWSDVPYYDEWLTVPNVVNIMHGNWSLADLFEAAQGHTGIAYKASTIIGTKLLSYDPRFTMFLGFACLIGAAAVLTSRYSRVAGRFPVLFTASLVAVWACIFSVHNWENLLAAWLINSAASLLLMAVTLVLIDRSAKASYVLGLVAALCCAFTFSNGLMIWPAAALVLWLSGYRGSRLIPLGICTVGFVIWMWVHRIDLGDNLNLASTPGRFFALIGTPLTFEHAVVSRDSPISAGAPLTTIVIGVVICGLIAVLVAIRTKLFRDFDALKDVRLSSAILIYGLGSCAMVALGRSEFPIAQALSSRYVATTFIVYIGLVLLCLEMISLRPVKILTAALSTVLIAAFVFAAMQEFRTGPFRHAYTEGWRKSVLSYATATDEQLANPHYTADEIRAWAAQLEAARAGPFARP